jgi:ubiquinone/menaquinone biosynthesis C-methylase UbiE
VIEEKNGEAESGTLNCGSCGNTYQVMNSIPRFVSPHNYATNFGFQWNRFRQTQLDSYSGLPISHDRFFSQTGWEPKELNGATVLDVGCGAGRFAEVVLNCGATVVALDYSSAVDACWENLKHHPNLSVVQGDIYSLPFKENCFDYVYCFGVLQHTPDVKRAFGSLPPHLKLGGHLAVDLYPSTLSSRLHPRYLIRSVTKRMQERRLFDLVERCTPKLLGLSRNLGRIPTVGRFLQRLIPVANYENAFPLDSRQLYEWAVLDTFDWLAPRYDQPQAAGVLLQWFAECKLESIEVLQLAHLTGRARRSKFE